MTYNPVTALSLSANIRTILLGPESTEAGWYRVGLPLGTLGTVVSATETTVTVAWDNYGEGSTRKPGETVVHPLWHLAEKVIEEVAS